MTRQEAIKRLEMLRGVFCVDTESAVDMAIEALKKVSVYEQIKWERDVALQTLEEHGIGFGQRAEEALSKTETVDLTKGDTLKEEDWVWGEEPTETVAECQNCKFYSVDGETTKYGYCNWHNQGIDPDNMCLWFRPIEVVAKNATTTNQPTDVETPTESADESTTGQPSDLIDRQATIKAMCSECEWKGECGGDCVEVAVVRQMPSAETTGQLDDVITEYVKKGLYHPSEVVAENATTTDTISRQLAKEEIARHDCTNGEEPYFTGKDVQAILDIVPPCNTCIWETCNYNKVDWDTEGDTISRQAALKAIREYINEYSNTDGVGLHTLKWCAMKEAEMVLETIPSIPSERKRGCWRKVQHQDKTYWKCSQCGMLHKYASNYCDSCGTDMRGIDNE